MTEDRKLSIICSKGNLDMAYPGLILANAARMLGIEANIFFTFWGMDIISKDKVDHLKVTPVGNTAMHMPQAIGWLPGMADMATVMMKKEMTKLDVPPVHEFLGMVHDAGCGILRLPHGSRHDAPDQGGFGRGSGRHLGGNGVFGAGRRGAVIVYLVLCKAVLV